MLCPHCRTSNLSNFEFCTNCGLRFNDEKETVLIPEAETVIKKPLEIQKPQRSGLSFLIILFLMLVGIGGGAYLLREKNINVLPQNGIDPGVVNRPTNSIFNDTQNVANEAARQSNKAVNIPQKQKEAIPGNITPTNNLKAINAAANTTNSAIEAAKRAANAAAEAARQDANVAKTSSNRYGNSRLGNQK